MRGLLVVMLTLVAVLLDCRKLDAALRLWPADGSEWTERCLEWGAAPGETGTDSCF